MNILGELRCIGCGLKTRFLVEKEENTWKKYSSKELYLLGDEIEKERIENPYQADCDYCEEGNQVHVILKDNVISAFLNKEEIINYSEGKVLIEKANMNAGIQKEKEKELNQFSEGLELDFESQPLSEGSQIEIKDEKWIINSIHKKESVEEDEEKRFISPFIDEYSYEVNNSKGEKRWLIVTNVEMNNAILQLDPPCLQESEKMYDVTDSMYKDELILERTVSDNYVIKVYKQLSGYRLFLYSKDDNNDYLEADLYKPSFDELLTKLEELISEEVE